MFDKIKKLTDETKLISFTIEGTHTDTQGSGNQEWKQKVKETVGEECKKANISQPADDSVWFAVYLLWFAVNTNGVRDLENLHLKPIIDSLNGKTWPDDNMKHVRLIINEVNPVTNKSGEKVEVTVYKVPEEPIKTTTDYILKKNAELYKRLV